MRVRTIIGVVLAASVAGCGGGDDCLAGATLFASEADKLAKCSATGQQPIARPAVVYAISGTAKQVQITYVNRQGGTQQETAALPWSFGFQGVDKAQLYVSAQNQGPDGSVIVTITVDGLTKKSSSSSGAYVIASAIDTCC